MEAVENLTLVTVCDNTFALLLAALLKSIEVNLTAPVQFDLYLVDDDIRPANRKKLLKSINPSIFTIHWLTLDEAIPGGMTLPIDQSTFPRNVYTRLFIPYFIPHHLSRVVYLDVDMIAHQDITALWSVDLGDKPLAAVIDRAQVMGSPWGGYANYRELGFSADTKVFNTGLLVINPIVWRESDVAQRVVSCIEQYAEHAVFADQYGLNVILANQWLELDPRWNCFSPSEEPDPYIIHFTGDKPIYTSYAFNKAYRDEFYRYLRMTQWRGYKPVGGWNRLLVKLLHKMSKKWYRLTT